MKKKTVALIKGKDYERVRITFTMLLKSSYISPTVASNKSYSGSSKSCEKKADPFNDDTDYEEDDDDDDDYDYNDYDTLEPKEFVPESGKR